MNDAMKKYAAEIMSNTEKYRQVASVGDKLFVYQVIGDKYPRLSDMYIFLIWDERLNGFQNSMATADDFCRSHLDCYKLMLSTAKTEYRMDSTGVTVVRKEEKN